MSCKHLGLYTSVSERAMEYANETIIQLLGTFGPGHMYIQHHTSLSPTMQIYYGRVRVPLNESRYELPLIINRQNLAILHPCKTSLLHLLVPPLVVCDNCTEICA